ncbi:MAG: helix-turn-helix transcriptional regulator [Anaerolineae bacterium]|nr:helix-turn-helix transcriptional regulator [Anaerolineae bacterium]MCO5199233.1 helix-turn-helix transcriptional regulator [Anaerolineae bacterium]
MESQPFAPLSESTYLILLTLAAGPQHGYAIMKSVADLSDGRVQLSTGTLYGAIKRLVNDGWIERFDEADYSGGRDRKAYRLTELGLRALNAEADRLRALLAAHVQVMAG